MGVPGRVTFPFCDKAAVYSQKADTPHLRSVSWRRRVRAGRGRRGGSLPPCAGGADRGVPLPLLDSPSREAGVQEGCSRAGDRRWGCVSSCLKGL